MSTMHLEDYLDLHAKKNPQHLAVICGEERITYSQLHSLVEEGCSKYAGLKGRLMPLKSSHNVSFLVDYFAIHRSGNVAVPLEQDYAGDVPNLSNIILPADSADVLYTTGSTGNPKGVVFSHRTIVANAENLIQAQGYHEKITFIINGPLNHFGSLSKVYSTIVSGGTICLLDGMKNLDAFFHAVNIAEGPVATFLVPACIRMLLAFASKQLIECMDKLEFIETGAAPISKDDMQRFRQLLPKSRLYNTYASTETGIVATFNYNNGNECQTGCVGFPLRNSGIVITDMGLIACKGDTLMTGYLNGETLSTSAIKENVFVTNDLGHFDVHGHLFIEGRCDDIINVGGYKIAPTEIESTALAFPLVEDCICVAGSHSILGTVLKLIVVPAKGLHIDKKELATFLCKRLAGHMVPTQYEEAENICRTSNGKLDRKAYR